MKASVTLTYRKMEKLVVDIPMTTDIEELEARMTAEAVRKAREEGLLPEKAYQIELTSAEMDGVFFAFGGEQ